MQQDPLMDEGEASPEPYINPEEPHPAVAVFIRRLQLAYETACSPGPMRLKEISQELTGKRRWIAKSTFYDNLSGERRTLPEWDWVALFIASLRRHLENTFLDPDQIGTVEEWSERYKAAKREVRSGRHGVAVDAAPQQESLGQAGAGTGDGLPQTCEEQARSSDDTVPLDLAAMFGDDDQRAGDPPAAESLARISTAEWASRTYGIQGFQSDRDASLGEHGRELRAAAQQGDREAACHLGILLLCWDAEDRQAMAWLADAADACDAMAMALHAAAPYKRRELAAAFALDLALPTGIPSSEDLLAPAGTTSRSPAVYYEAAAHAGNPEAAYRLGRLKEAQGEYWDAAQWFNLAAEAHHPEAIQRIEKMKP